MSTKINIQIYYSVQGKLMCRTLTDFFFIFLTELKWKFSFNQFVLQILNDYFFLSKPLVFFI